MKSGPPVLWMAGGTCGGCSISALNAMNPTIEEVILNLVTLHYHVNIAAASGNMILDHVFDTMHKEKGNYIYIQEGTVPTAADGRFCIIGEHRGKPITMLAMAQALAANAQAVVAIGSCASYGGIPSAPPNPTGVKPLSEIVSNPVVNIPGCPVHPDDLFGTLLYYLKHGLPELDKYGRPKLFFPNLHDNCPLLPQFENENFAGNWGEKDKCLALLGCVGPTTHCNAAKRGWNNGINWCVKSGSRCIGCTEPTFAKSEAGLYDLIDADSI